MKTGFGIMAGLALCALSACAVATISEQAELVSLEFGQDRYLTDAYLAATPGARCGHPFSDPAIVEGVPGMVDVWGPLPDGTWFRVFMTGPSPADEPTMIVLERGVGTDEAQLTVLLNEVEGIVRLQDEGREVEDAWGVYSPRAEWLRDLGRRARSLSCATG